MYCYMQVLHNHKDLYAMAPSGFPRLLCSHFTSFLTLTLAFNIYSHMPFTVCLSFLVYKCPSHLCGECLCIL